MVSTRFFRQAAFAGLAALLMTSSVAAQPPGGVRGMGGVGGFRIDRALLLGSDKVREELNVAGDQAAKIDAALDAYRKDLSSSPRPDFQKMTEEERKAFYEKVRSDRDAQSKKMDETLGALLEPAQIKRLDEIALQLGIQTAAIATLKSDKVKEKLSLTEKQLASLTEAETDAADELRKMGEAAEKARLQGADTGGSAAMREKIEGLQKRTTQTALGLLTDEQKTALTALEGEPTKVEVSDVRPGGFRGRGKSPRGQ